MREVHTIECACGKPADEEPEYCWFCQAALCWNCWERVGHCGHPDADAINKQSLLANHEQRAALIKPFAKRRLPDC